MSDPPRSGSGVLLVDKPLGITSHDVVSLVRRRAGTRKVGHAGTLDPLATGLLMLGIESSTRLLTYLVGLDKQYTATIRLGESTTTDDAAGEPIAHSDAGGLTPEEVTRAIASLTGEIDQVPSTFSAIRVDGRHAYDLARAGHTVELRPRTVTVSRFDVLATRPGRALDLDVRIEVSSGTYIRALARDLGDILGVGGHLTALRRTRVGPFVLDDATAPDDGVMSALRSAASIAEKLWPMASLTAAQTTDLVHGKRVALAGDAIANVPILAVLTPEGRLAGLVEMSGGTARVLVNFPTTEVVA